MAASNLLPLLTLCTTWLMFPMKETQVRDLIMFGWYYLADHFLPASVFAPLNELIEGLPPEQLERWERLWMVSDRRIGRIHPLIYSHPVTGLKVCTSDPVYFKCMHGIIIFWNELCVTQTLCFHLGMTEAFVWDYNTPDKRFTNWPETQKILQEIHHEFVKDNGAIQYSHKVTSWIPCHSNLDNDHRGICCHAVVFLMIAVEGGRFHHFGQLGCWSWG